MKWAEMVCNALLGVLREFLMDTQRQMKIKLAYKLFLAFLLTSLISIVLMVGIMRYFVIKGFEDFINKLEMETLGEYVDQLKTEYSEQQGWDFIRENPRAFRDIFLIDEPSPVRDRKTSSSPFSDERHEKDDKVKDMPPPSPQKAIVRRLSLFDEQMRTIQGRAVTSEDHILREIVVDGKTVGFLGLKKRRKFSHPLEEHFIYRQSMAFVIIGFSVLLLSALVAFLLSRQILRPIRQLTDGAHALASRKFETRIAVHSGDELGQLAQDFNRMAQTLERYETMRQQWISDISHELRTPIAILRGEIEAIQDGVREINGKTLESVHAEVMLLAKLVEDLHNLSMAETEALSAEHKPVIVCEVLQDSVNMFAARFSQKQITVHFEPEADHEIIVMADHDRMSQVYANILENTLRYTESPGELKIRLEADNQNVHIHFEDTKPGVPDDSLLRIFDRLYRIDPSRSRQNGGSGLGLAICKSIVKSFGGEIRAAHSSLGGLRIEIILPRIMDA
ncbi:MAG: HAMP domain-containing protein [Deltaproteobacteria bacterium]|nr:HAMP domain-containing protein [Deltaproteobacteria bacterium]